MATPGRIYVSCATADKDWLDRVLVAWKPIANSETVDFFHREKELDYGSLEYHAAVLLVAEHYFADAEADRELKRFIQFGKKKRGLFWIPVHPQIWHLTPFKGILPAWGFQGAEVDPKTVISLDPKNYGDVWTEVGNRIYEWWCEAGVKLGDTLEDTRQNNLIVTDPKDLATPPGKIRHEVDTASLDLLPCLIDREPQVMPLRKRAYPKTAGDSSSIVFVIPGPTSEAPDLFHERLSRFTFVQHSDGLPQLPDSKNKRRADVSFVPTGWPTFSEGDDAANLLMDYIDLVFGSLTLQAECNRKKSLKECMNEAASIVQSRMGDLRLVFWAMISAGETGNTSKELFRNIFEWWRLFASPDDYRFLAPIVVLVVTAGKSDLDGLLPDGPVPSHVTILPEMSPIKFQHMLDWHEKELKRVKPGLSLFSKINKLFPTQTETIPLFRLASEVIKWLNEN